MSVFIQCRQKILFLIFLRGSYGGKSAQQKAWAELDVTHWETEKTRQRLKELEWA